MAKNKQFFRSSGQKGGYRGQSQQQQDEQQALEGDETLVDIVEVKESAQDFFERNQTMVLGIVVGAILLLGAFLGYKYGIQAPKEKAGMEAIYKAQNQFQRDSFALALENPGAGFEGFLDIIDNYSGTKAANLATYYAGVSYLNLGKYEAAIEYLADYDANDEVTGITKNGAMGDAYAELGEMDKAKGAYQKAVSSDNDLLTPYYLNKLALLSMKNGDTATAISTFERIKNDFPQAAEAKDAAKYIARYQ